ncbi:PilZ domain-containing protein [Shewanella gaetbuli]|uniref:PilZ domain-containing protein n=1 Tax=Shewanella gaetbuli TaxID=220752 RepID=A0A9X2CKD7_9GAMM|nr:PilZ domain-containing protein [Shewanella gaetbuli]MCL1141514.1 PilZ domain-containing protein [Shewanella gaetbuli]
MSLDNHSALIEQLKPLMMEPDFQELFERLTVDESNSTRFLLKMELTRISAPCTRIIDLRDKTELPCEEVLIGKQRHFLDKPSKDALEKTLPLYKNQYTLGVYESIINTHKKRKQIKQENGTSEANQQSKPFMVSGIVMGSYFNRSEERMNYSIKISASQAGVPEVIGATLDLSVGGARIKLPLKHQFQIEKPLKVKLLELNEEFYFEDLHQGVNYQIVDIQNKQEHAVFRLKRDGGGEELDKLITQLIRGYKFRYKVDVNDVIVTASGLGFERHYLPFQQHLPLYVSIQENKPKLTHCLLGHGNQGVMYYFQDEKDISQLPGMLTNNRLVNLLKSPSATEHQLLFCFTHHANGKLHFYSATLAELQQSGHLGLFLGFASRKPSWRVFKLNSYKIDHKQNYKTSTLPGDDAHYSALTEQQLASLSHVIQLSDLTNEHCTEQYQSWFKNQDVKLLKSFIQRKLISNSIKRISMPFTERRHESRYAFKTLVKIKQGNTIATGITHDISNRGLQITLDENVNFTSPSAVSISFPRLQAKAGKIDLTSLPYQLIRTRSKGQILHLSALIGHEPHAGVEFLSKLITHNKEKLAQLSDQDGEQIELADGLKNLMMRELNGVPFFIEKTAKSTIDLSAIGIGIKVDTITQLFSQDTDQILQYNLAPIMDNGLYKTQIVDPLKKRKPNAGMTFFEVFIQITHHARGTINLSSKLVSELNSTQQKAFIEQSERLGKFMALRVSFGAADKPDMSYIRRELEYIQVHSSHRAKQLEEQLWRVIGIGELLDITVEAKMRYPQLQPNTTPT